VVFLTDVDGIYDKSPHLPGAQLMSRIEVGMGGNISHAVCTVDDGVKKDDVTGGMKLKLGTAIQIIVSKKRVYSTQLSRRG